MAYNIFLDDERFPSDKDPREYTIVRNYDDFVNLVTTLGLPDFITFDHDLGTITSGEKTGHDCAKWLIEYLLDKNLRTKINFEVHSQNFVGARNIRNLLRDWNRKMAKSTDDG